MLARTDSRARALFLLIAATLVAGLIGGRLAWWQVIERGWLEEMARQQLEQTAVLPAERGEIVDRSGVLLATSIELKSVFATPPSIDDPESTAALLAPVLGLEVDALRARLDGDDA